MLKNGSLYWSGSVSKKYLLLFLLWPFISFLVAIKNYRQKEAKSVVYIFLIYYGLTFIINEIGGEGSDSERYAMRLISTSKLPFSDFFKIIGGLYTDTTVDVVEPLISFIVSRFTDQYQILFAVFAGIFGFFYLKSINLLHERYINNPGWNALIFMSFFVLILPITMINGFRMWTAAWIFFYGAYYVVLYREIKYLILIFGASLVHFSFLAPTAILIIYLVVGNRNFIYVPLALLSFSLPQIMTPIFQKVSYALGGAIQNRYEGYSSENYGIARQELVEQATWFMQISQDLVFYYLIFTLIVIRIWYTHIMISKADHNLFSFLLLFLSFVNFGKSIPSFGGRFMLVFFLFATLYIFLCAVQLCENRLKIFTIIGIFPMALFAAINFRIGSESLSVWLFTPGFGLPLLAPVMSVANILFN